MTKHALHAAGWRLLLALFTLMAIALLNSNASADSGERCITNSGQIQFPENLADISPQNAYILGAISGIYSGTCTIDDVGQEAEVSPPNPGTGHTYRWEDDGDYSETSPLTAYKYGYGHGYADGRMAGTRSSTASQPATTPASDDLEDEASDDAEDDEDDSPATVTVNTAMVCQKAVVVPKGQTIVTRSTSEYFTEVPEGARVKTKTTQWNISDGTVMTMVQTAGEPLLRQRLEPSKTLTASSLQRDGLCVITVITGYEPDGLIYTAESETRTVHHANGLVIESRIQDGQVVSTETRFGDIVISTQWAGEGDGRHFQVTADQS